MTSAELLRKAASALDEGIDPFGEGFLHEHDVTLSQVIALAQQLAVGARMVVKAIEQPESPQGVAMIYTLAEAS